MIESKEAINELTALLNEEITLHKSYALILTKEKDAIVGFKPDEIENFVVIKEATFNRIKELEQSRIEFIRRHTGGEAMGLTTFVNGYLQPKDSAKIHPLIKQLKMSIGKSYTECREFAQVLQYASA